MAFWALAVLCVVWGTTYAAIAVAVRSMPPFSIGAIRFTLAGGLMLAAGRAYGLRFPNARDWMRLTISTSFLLVMANGLIVWGEQFIPSSLTALVVTGTPFFFVGLASLLGERVPPLAWGGMIMGFVGIGVLLWPQLLQQIGTSAFDPHFMAGCAAALGGSFAWAVGAVYSRQRPASCSKWMSIGAEMLVAGVILAAVSTMLGEWKRFHPSLASWIALIYLIVFGSWIGYGCFSYCLTHLPPHRVSIYSYINPVVAVLLGWALPMLREEVTAWTLAGSAIVLAGVMIVNQSRAQTDEEGKLE